MPKENGSYKLTTLWCGFFYQREISIYILVRLLMLGQEFFLSLERKDAPSFDDVVFTYGPENERKCRFVQCKHKETGELKKAWLESPSLKNSFCLKKYVQGFDIIKNEYNQIHDLIMFTNVQQGSNDIIGGDELDDMLNLHLHKLAPVYQERLRLSPDSLCDEFLEKFKFCFTESIKRIEEMIRSDLKTELDGHYAEEFYYRLKELIEGRLVNWTTTPITHDDIQRDVKKPLYGDIRYEFPDYNKDFCGRINELQRIQNPENFAVIYGREGIGKTQLGLKFACENQFKHLIKIDARSEESIEESYNKLAYQKLRLKTRDFQGNVKDLQTIKEEVSQFFMGNKTVFLFDDAKREFTLPQPLEGQFILVTTREDIFRNRHRVELGAFTPDEATAYIRIRLPDESVEHVSTLAERCQFIPEEICSSVNRIEKRNKMLSMLRELDQENLFDVI